MAYKVVDLFAGAGGLSLGFMQTGKFEIVAAAENNPGARKTYKRNHKLTRLYPDVRTIDYRELEESCGKIDVVIGGPPCQGFSNANRQHTTIISMNNRLVKESRPHGNQSEHIPDGKHTGPVHHELASSVPRW